MRVRVVREWERILSAVCLGTGREVTLFVTAEKEYTVYGMSWHKCSSLFGQPMLACEITDNYGNLISAPIDIFDVADGRIPDIWRIEKREDAVLLWPEVFLNKFFFDDLSEGVPECVHAFQNIKKLLEGPNGDDGRRPKGDEGI
jgi:hypothetical protein